MGDSREAIVLRDRDAASQRRVAAGRRQQSMAGRSRSKAIRCIPRAAERPTHSRRLPFSISTIRRVRSISSNRLKKTSKEKTWSAKRAIALNSKNIWLNCGRKLAADGGAGLAFLVEETHSPTRDRLRAELEKDFPQMRWCVYEPLLTEAQNFSTQIAFGENTRLVPQLGTSRCDSRARQRFPRLRRRRSRFGPRFHSRRRVAEAKDTMNRLYVVENRYTLTGAMADHRLRCPASQIPAFAHALAGKIAAATEDAQGSVLSSRH